MLVSFVAPVCFSQECQQAADQAFIAACTIPVLVAVSVVAYLLRPLPKDREDLFQDPATGTVFEAPAGEEPERDKDGLLAFRAISYTPWPVPADTQGTRLRIPVGPVCARQPRTFVFERRLPGRSEVLAVTLPRPLGVVLEWDERRKWAVVAGLIAGSAAEQRRRQAALNGALRGSALIEGDVLRAVTATNVVYPTRALFGVVAPQRHAVLYGCDKQRWASVRTALRKGDSRDGEVTVVVERPLDTDPGSSSGGRGEWQQQQQQQRGASDGGVQLEFSVDWGAAIGFGSNSSAGGGMNRTLAQCKHRT